MKYVLGSVLFLTSFSLSMSASVPIDTEAVSKSVVFIYRAGADGQPGLSMSSGATGFFIAVPRMDSPSGGYLLLLTARHVAGYAFLRVRNARRNLTA
jgi:hypothetical protein